MSDIFVLPVKSMDIPEVAELVQRLVLVERQRDQLLEALGNALGALESYVALEEGEFGIGRSMEDLERSGDLPACIINARAVIAAVEEAK